MGGNTARLAPRGRARFAGRAWEPASTTTELIRADIEARLGFFPPFFEPALHNPRVLENLWSQTVRADLDNPLPERFKEKLNALLSRHCAVPYCLVCHTSSLRPLGMSATAVLRLLETPPPAPEDAGRALAPLAALTGELGEWPPDDSELERALLDASVLLFLQARGDRDPLPRESLRRTLGDRYADLVAFLAYVRACHAWMEAHPEVSYEADDRVRQHLGPLVQAEPALAEFLRDYRERVGREPERRAVGAAVAAERARLEEDLEQRVQQRTRELAERSSEHETFVHTASHDLRAPLLSIEGMSILLERAIASGDHEETAFTLGRIRANVARMGQLLEDLLALARVGRAAPVTVDAAEAVGGALEELEPRLRERGVEVVLPADWPRVRLPRADASQLMSNLLGNAVKHAGRPGEPPRVTVGWDEDGAFDRLRIEDNGRGIPPEHRERVFQLFDQLDPAAEGSGVGLAIVKRIVERHGGRVFVRDSDLGGARVEVTVPAERRERHDPAYAGPERRRN